MTPRRSLALVLTAAVVVAAWTALHVSSSIPFDSDEANHANIGLRQYQDLAGGHLMDFVRHSYRTGQFPFLHGWMQIPFFAALGSTRYAARVAQTALLVVGALATAWACHRAAGDDDVRRQRVATLVGGILFAASPTLGSHAGLCMLETPGAAMTALSLAAFAEAVRATGRRAVLWHVATAAAVLATFFTKLNYGIWIGPAVFAGYVAWWWKADDRRAALRGAAVYAGVSLLVLAVWYSRSDQRAAFLGFLHNPAERIPVERDDPTFRIPGISWTNFTAYFRLVAEDYHVHGVLGAATLLAFAAGLRPRALLANPVRVAAAACLVWTWLVLSMEFRQYALARFIASALPALWIVAATPIAAAVRRVPGGVLAGAGVLVLGVQVWLLPARLAVDYEIDERYVPVFAFVVESVGAPASVACVNTTDHTSARSLVFDLATRPGRTYRDADVKAFVGGRVFESPKRFHDWMTAERPWGGPDWSSYVVEYTWDAERAEPLRQVPDTLAMWSAAIRSYGTRLERVAERRFDETGVTVTIWRDRRSPVHRGLVPR